MVKLKKIQRKAGISLEKQRLFKMGMLEKNFLVKALCDAQKSSGSETSGEVQSLINKTVNAPKGKLYLKRHGIPVCGAVFKWNAQRLSVCGQKQRRD